MKKKLYGLLAVILSLCMLVTVLPLLPFFTAEVTIQRYELDTDGIDTDGVYLIVSANQGSANALRFQESSGWFSSSYDFANQAVEVLTDHDGTKYIETEFTNEATCQFAFSGTTGGRIVYDSKYYMKLSTSILSSDGFTTSTSSATSFTFNHKGDGEYQLYRGTNSKYYLRCNNGSWTQGSSNTAYSVYLFKLTNHVVRYDVTYNGNGYTEGTLPENAPNLDQDTTYTVEAPVDLCKDVDEDSWVFRCWNTKADGTGDDYYPGDTITIEESVTLYAQWNPVVKYTVTMITYLNGVPTDVDEISGVDKRFFIQREDGDGTYIPMKKTAVGTYTKKVEDNGTYVVYSKVGDGDYEPVHGHKVTIFNQGGTTECMHYSVTHDLAGGSWPAGFDYDNHPHHAGETHYAPTAIPELEGNRFLGWQDADGNVYQPGYLVTASIDKAVVLTALWEKTVDVTVNITLDHTSADGGVDYTAEKTEVTFDVMRTDEEGYNHLIGTITVTEDNHGEYVYTFNNGVSSYVLPDGKVNFGGLQKGNYTISLTKSCYEATYETVIDEIGNTTILVNLKYTPTNFDLGFDVVVDDWANVPAHLRPYAVNVKVTYWGYNADNVLDWHIISQQDGENPPISVVLNAENGTGSGFYPVWKFWGGEGSEIYYYRVAVTSYLMADGTLVPASTEDYVDYVGGVYTGTVSINPNGGVPQYPDGSNTTLRGTIYDSQTDAQDSRPTVNVAVKPFTVTFQAQPGTVNGQQTLVLKDQYLYPDLNEYVAVPNTNDRVFICWLDENGEPAVDMAGQLLTGNVTYTARYNDNIILSGDITVPATYMQDEQVVFINTIDLPSEVLVILQKNVGGVYMDVDSLRAVIRYEEAATEGTGSYEFINVPNNGTEYRVVVRALNYDAAYDNNADGDFSEDESVAIVDVLQAVSSVDARLQFNPASYYQTVKVDTTQIHENLRPTDALVQILYRDLGDIHPYKVISQHSVAPGGIPVPLKDATGMGFESVWNWHTDSSLYEYQAQVSMLYGNNVVGAYTQEGTPYTADSPYTIKYGPATNYIDGAMLTATLIPKEYPVVLDLNLGDDPDTPVYGLEHFMVDDGEGGERYVYMHTWSFANTFIASPYREGYVFAGWESSNEDDVYITETGKVHVGATLAQPVTLTAKWIELKDTDYTIRYLELNTDKVLRSAMAVSGVAAGSSIKAVDAAQEITGYVYAGAMINEVYYDKTENPAMTLTHDPLKNLMVIYYLPDGSDGYTEQVESNLHINKTAVLENNGTYTITLDTYTKDNPITTLIQQNTPLDIVLVLDQSGSLAENSHAYLNELGIAVDNFIELVANHGRRNEVDHRIAIVGYAGDVDDKNSLPDGSEDNAVATGGKKTDSWINTGVFDSNGEFHLYNYKGFNYQKLANNSSITANGVYYTKVTTDGKDHYLLLTHHTEYHQLLNAEQARVASLQGETIYGYVFDSNGKGGFVELTRNSSGLWLYGDKLLYSDEQFYTYHTDVWTHRDGLGVREIHAYGVGANYRPIDGHEGVYTRTVVENAGQQSIYKDALMPVTLNVGGSGDFNPSLKNFSEKLGADSATRASYGMEMANKILEENPIDPAEGRLRLVVMFTDGEPGYIGFDSSWGDDYYQQAVTEANAAINYAYTAKNTYGAYVYTIGLYPSSGVGSSSDAAYFMNALSSNYPNAKSMDNVKRNVKYGTPANGTRLEDNGEFFVYTSSKYYRVFYGNVKDNDSSTTRNQWYYNVGSKIYSISTAANPTISNGKVGNYTIRQQQGSYAETKNSGYYSTTNDAAQLKAYFEDVLQDITTKITTEIVLHSDTILRDIMNQGLVLTDGTVITAYLQEGNYDKTTGNIIWSVDANGDPILDEKVSLTVGKQTSAKDDESGVEIIVHNYDAANATNPTGSEYQPHTVDVTGYNFHEWYINETKTKGYKMVVTITRVEARDDVEWGRSTSTNNEQSGMWLPEDENGNRELLLPFNQPSTIFVERAYVLDYGKEFKLSGWYFDDENGKNADPIHLDCDIESGMNWFDPANPTISNLKDGVYGNTKYGNVRIEDGEVYYAPTTMQWGGYDQFYVFGNTWRKTVLSQDANENGNLWNKVTVIPANNVYYEDAFVTTESTTQNGIEGFVFSEGWEIVGGEGAGDNYEIPEHQETPPYGDVHGWTDSLQDDFTYTDGSAHGTGLDGQTVGASAAFTFTGTGVEVYTRTNAESGMVVAFLTDAVGGQVVKSIAVDNLAVSGDYYHIPTVSFKNLPYGTYTVNLIATIADVAVDGPRYEYYIDGVRIYNPLGSNTNYQENIVKDAYGLEVNAVFTEVRDILIEYEDFNKDMEDGTDGKMGAVFIDWIQPGQESGNDQAGVGVPTYEVGTFEAYGPKNEVYLSSGQAIVLKVQEDNFYYVGLKSLKGDTVTVHVSGISQAQPTEIQLSHTTDMYYRVTPVEGYIVIQNASEGDEILSITNLRTTNLTAPVDGGGILPVAEQEAIEIVSEVARYMANRPAVEDNLTPEEPEVYPSLEEYLEANRLLTDALFADVKTWLKTA